jgi:DNA-binding response OmpR family regulator/anti-sigma regulatory factor (Ser/Thr protein kinase)
MGQTNITMKTILVIEDEKELRESLTEMLTFEGYSVTAATDGAEGVIKAREIIPDLILCDILMPRLNGYEVLSELKKDLTTAMVPFIFLTALSDQKKIRQGMNTGADDYIVKPFLRKELLEAIESRLEKSTLFQGYADQNLEKLRRNIISFLPHELVTPLNSIISFGEIIKDHASVLSTSELSEMGDFIFQSGKRFYDLIQKYILYIRFAVNKESGKQGAVCTHCRTVISASASQIADSSQRVDDLTIEVDEVSLNISDEELQIIVRELTDNAFKFSIPGAKVSITGSPVNGMYEITVSDHGRGIPKETIRHIGAFMQFDREQHEQQGIGLGLFLVRQIAELNQGSIEIQSEPEQGTRVIVRIPVTVNP